MRADVLPPPDCAIARKIVSAMPVACVGEFPGTPPGSPAMEMVFNKNWSSEAPNEFIGVSIKPMVTLQGSPGVWGFNFRETGPWGKDVAVRGNTDGSGSK